MQILLSTHYHIILHCKQENPHTYGQFLTQKISKL